MVILVEKVLHSKQHVVIKALRIDFYDIWYAILRFNKSVYRSAIYNLAYSTSLPAVEPMVALIIVGEIEFLFAGLAARRQVQWCRICNVVTNDVSFQQQEVLEVRFESDNPTAHGLEGSQQGVVSDVGSNIKNSCVSLDMLKKKLAFIWLLDVICNPLTYKSVVTVKRDQKTKPLAPLFPEHVNHGRSLI